MRILQLGPYPPPHGGVQTHLVAIRQFLRDRGVPCAVINITRFRKAPADDVHYPRTVVELLALLLRLRYDVVHLHVGGELTTRLLALGLVCCFVPRARAVLTFHSGGYPGSEAGRRSGPLSLSGFVLRRFDRLIGVNREIVDFFRRLGVPATRVQLIPPHAPVAAPAPAPLPEPLQGFLARHRPCLVTVGLLEPEYDLPLQVEAMGLVRRRFPEAGLVIVGAGSLDAELRERITRTPYGEDLLLCGDVAHPVVLRLLAASDLFLRTTRFDGDSVSVREALQLGVPVVATDNGMRPVGVDLVPTGDPTALAETIERRLLGRPEPGPTAELTDGNLEAVLDLYQELAG